MFIIFTYIYHSFHNIYYFIKYVLINITPQRGPAEQHRRAYHPGGRPGPEPDDHLPRVLWGAGEDWCRAEDVHQVPQVKEERCPSSSSSKGGQGAHFRICLRKKNLVI